LVFRQVFFGVDGIYWAFWFTQTAVDTLFWINHKEVGPFVETVDGTHFNTISQLAADTRIDDYVSHKNSPVLAVTATC
jgi:hypothetical protein